MTWPLALRLSNVYGIRVTRLLSRTKNYEKGRVKSKQIYTIINASPARVRSITDLYNIILYRIRYYIYNIYAQ